MSQEAGHASYQLVRLSNGRQTVYSSAYDEKMHPGLGPAAEADLLYVRQLNLPERMQAGAGEFVVWDVGLGAAANAIAVLRATRNIERPLRLVSFDNTTGPLAFALANVERLGYFQDYEIQTRTLLERREVDFQNGRSRVRWEVRLEDFPTLMSRRGRGNQARITIGDRPRPPDGGCIPPPHAVLFDAFSPAKNPAMWTRSLFTDLFRALDPMRPCNLTTYSRSTMVRVTLLLAGFYVGRGVATGLKEETTVAANTPALIATPLDRQWLERARRSDSAEPLRAAAYSRAKLGETTCELLRAHPQFRQVHRQP